MRIARIATTNPSIIKHTLPAPGFPNMIILNFSPLPLSSLSSWAAEPSVNGIAFLHSAVLETERDWT